MTKKATWTNEGTHEGVTEWSLYIDGEYVGSLERQRPTRYCVGARLGLARDTSKPWQYDGDAFDLSKPRQDGVSKVVSVKIPEGSTLREAKALVEAAARAEIAR
jgi:hypothetical protein